MHAEMTAVATQSLKIIFNELEKRRDRNILRQIDADARYFGLEISSGNGQILDYRNFKVLPLFLSITWLGDLNIAADPIENAPALELAQHLRPHSNVVSYLSCYKLTRERLLAFLNSGVRNVLALRGDFVDERQEFRYASQLVTEIRKRKTDDEITIFVGGYPDVHPEAASRKEDLQFLKEKVECGANAIITQLCFSYENLRKFILDCRNFEIKVPIIPGIYVPNSYRALLGICRLTSVKVPKNLFEEYQKRQNDSKEFQRFSIENSVEFIQKLFSDKELTVNGVQFFTLNNFECVKIVIERIF